MLPDGLDPADRDYATLSLCAVFARDPYGPSWRVDTDRDPTSENFTSTQ
jgi:hypothetical protein